MAEYDLVIRGGTIVDGTGIPRYKADMAIKDGRIAKISGRINPGAAREIDASGCIVSPGAIDLHTHYDAQLSWDPYCSLSGWFGVTSLTIGQCGFGFAPTKPEDRDMNMRMMNRIEAIPLESMRRGMRWDWETFPQFMESLERHGLGLNVGALFPFSPMRGYVLGMMPARERTSVTEAELNQMKRLFDEAMQAGAFGFSLNMNLEDRPDDGGFLPSQVASDEEFFALAEVLSHYGVGHIGQTVGFGLTSEQRRRSLAAMTEMMRISGRPLHVGLGQSDYPNPDDVAWMKSVSEEDLPLYTQMVAPLIGVQFTLAEFNSYDYMPNWVQPLVGSREERLGKLQDPGVRIAMKQDVSEWGSVEGRADWDRLKVLGAAYERNYDYDGMTIRELAKATGKDPVDAFLDLAIDERLETEFEILPSDSPEVLKSSTRKLTDPHCHISLSDGGAHTRYTTISHWPVYWLAYWIRDNGIMSLEEGTHKMSALPAWLADFKGRGTLRAGNWADVIVYNLEELGYVYDRAIYEHDFPGGERRLIQKPRGLRYTIVNGTVTFEGNDCTGALPGKLLRSYDMVG